MVVAARVIAIVAVANWLLAPLLWLTDVMSRENSLFIAVFPLFPLLALSTWLRKRARAVERGPE